MTPLQLLLKWTIAQTIAAHLLFQMH